MKPGFLARLRAGDKLVSDGATGTNLQARGLLSGTPPEAWVFDNPEAVRQLHREFVAAGAMILLTDTFGGTSLRLEHAGLRDRAAEVNRCAVALAREAAGSAAWVAGSIGPLGQLLEPLGELNEREATGAFAAQARALAEAGADLLVIETQFDLHEATCAVKAVRSTTTLPLVCSFSFDMGRRTMMGHSPEEVARTVEGLGVDAAGVNCGRSLEDNLANLNAMRATTSLPVWMKPNAGLPRMEGDVAIYDVTPAQMGEQARQWLSAGAAVIGGCCGTTPLHLKAIASAVAGVVSQ